MSFEIGTASNFEDLFIKLETFLTSRGHAFGKRFSGIGTGNFTTYQGKVGTVAQTITCTATSATSFDVVGSVSGALGTATVGTPFTSAQIDFTITAGGTAYVAGDVWTITVSPAWTLSRQFNGVWRNNVTIGLTSFTHGGAAGQNSIRAIRPFECREITITPASAEQTPSAFQIDWSDDGTNWTNAQSYSGVTTGWNLSVARRFAVAAAGTHRWWRIRTTAYNTTNVNVTTDYFDTVASGAGWQTQFPWMAVKSPGNDGLLQTVFHSLQAQDIPGSDIYSMVVYPHTSYSALNSADTQPGRDGGFAIVPAANIAMNYWMVANGRRFAMGLKVSTIYAGMYMGLMLPYARPSVYPLPWFLGGSSSNAATRWSDSGTSVLNVFARAQDSASVSGQAAVRDITGVWRHVAQHNILSSDATFAPGRMYPQSLRGSGSGINYVRENFGGGYPLIPLAPGVTSVGMMGEIDGCFWTTGFGQAAENTINVDRFDHVVFQNIFRNTIADYWALRMD